MVHLPARHVWLPECSNLVTQTLFSGFNSSFATSLHRRNLSGRTTSYQIQPARCEFTNFHGGGVPSSTHLTSSCDSEPYHSEGTMAISGCSAIPISLKSKTHEGARTCGRRISHRTMDRRASPFTRCSWGIRNIPMFIVHYIPNTPHEPLWAIAEQ